MIMTLMLPWKLYLLNEDLGLSVCFSRNEKQTWVCSEALTALSFFFL